MHTSLLITAACLLGLLSTVGASLPYPILPPLFAADAANSLNNYLGLPPKLLFGIALAINPLGLLIGSALLGPLSDRYGRKPVLILSAGGAAIGHAITAWALVLQSFPLLVAARFFTGLMEGNGSVARAMLADRLEGPLRLKAMSWLNSGFYMGWLIGPLLAGMTMQWGVTTPFWIAVVALLVSAAMVAIALPKEEPSLETTGWWQVARDQHSLNLLRVPALKTLFVVQLTYTCGVTAFYEFYPLWLVEVADFRAPGIAWTTAGLCAMMTLASIRAGRSSDLHPLARARVLAFTAAAAIAVLAFGNAWIGIAAIVVFGLPNAYYNAIIPNWCAERFGAHGQGAVMGLISTTFCLANILMAIAGSVFTLIDTRLILILGAILTTWAGCKLGAWRSDLARAEGRTTA